MSRLAVTTSKHERAAEQAEALALAAELGAEFRPRRRRSLARFIAEEQLDAAIAVQAGQPVWRDRAGAEFRWHPNMAIGRLRALRSGGTDRLLEFAAIRPGDRVLDATLGLGADAIVLSHGVGPEGCLVGVESSPIIAALVRRGLATYDHALAEPMRRVRVIGADGERVLAAPARWDVVYFDPMFDQPLDSPGLSGLRALADHRPLPAETVQRARALVNRAVVVKSRAGDEALAAMGPARQVTTGRVQYAWFAPTEREAEDADVTLG